MPRRSTGLPPRTCIWRRFGSTSLLRSAVRVAGAGSSPSRRSTIHSRHSVWCCWAVAHRSSCAPSTGRAFSTRRTSPGEEPWPKRPAPRRSGWPSNACINTTPHSRASMPRRSWPVRGICHTSSRLIFSTAVSNAAAKRSRKVSAEPGP